MSLLVLRNSVQRARNPRGELRAVETELARAGHRDRPEHIRGNAPDGRPVDLYVWRNTPFGNVGLVTGPDVEGSVHELVQHNPGDPTGDVYVPGQGPHPALTTGTPRASGSRRGRGGSSGGARRNTGGMEGVLRSTLLPEDVAGGTRLFLAYEDGRYVVRSRWQDYYRSRRVDPNTEAGHRALKTAEERFDAIEAGDVHRNAGGGRSRSGGRRTPPRALTSAVNERKSEQAQVNAVVRYLVNQGVDADEAGRPEVWETSVDRATFRLYVWRDTPFGEPVLLGAGPSFEPKVALASQIANEPGVGAYIHGVLAQSKTATRIARSSASTASRTAKKPKPARKPARKRKRKKAPAAPPTPREGLEYGRPLPTPTRPRRGRREGPSGGEWVGPGGPKRSDDDRMAAAAAQARELIAMLKAGG